MNFIKRVVLSALALVGLGSVANAASILPADLAATFADGVADITTIIGLIFGVVVTLYIFKVVRSTFSK